MALGPIVIVEDEKAIRQGVVEVLRSAGYQPIEAADGLSGLDAARRPDVRLVLLDLLLPKLDGMDVLKKLRTTHPSLPVIILTARGTEEERVAGLRAGADDYVVKPFSARELLARVEAVLRRSPERPTAVQRLRDGRLMVDLARREFQAGREARQALSETECSILVHLAAHAGRAISREELLARVWGVGHGVETRTIDMHVARLRAKLSSATGEDGERYIVTVRGTGYMLGAELRVEALGSAGAAGGAS